MADASDSADNQRVPAARHPESVPSQVPARYERCDDRIRVLVQRVDTPAGIGALDIVRSGVPGEDSLHA
jgi:hypothetical protein